MATVITSIGSNSSIDTETTSSCSGAGPYVVTYGTAPTGVSVGDLAVITDDGKHFSEFQYVVTAVSGADITLRYLTDDMAIGDTSPCDLYVDGEIDLAPTTFKRMYSTMTLWDASLDDAAMYANGDDAVGECYNDSIFDERVTIDGGTTVGLNSVKLSVASGERHDGTRHTGARIVKSADWEDGIIYSDYDMAVTIEWLEIDGAGYGDVPSSGTVGSVIQVGGVTSHASLYRKIIKNCIVHDANGNSNSMYALYRRDSSCTWTVMNNIVYDLGVETGSTHVKGVVTFATSPGATYYYNNTVYKLTNNGDNGDSTGIQVDDDTDEIFKNNLICDVDLGSTSGYEQCYSGNSGSTPYRITEAYNLTSDATAAGVGSLTGKSAANQFVSTVNDAEDLHLKNNADALRAGIDLGTTPTGVSVDIDGRDRDAEGDELGDIGADQCDSCAEPAGSTNSYLNMTTLGVG
jgi:hypothetical protein